MTRWKQGKVLVGLVLCVFFLIFYNGAAYGAYLSESDNTLAGLTLASTLSDAELLFVQPTFTEVFVIKGMAGSANPEFRRSIFEGVEVISAVSNGKLWQIGIVGENILTPRGIGLGQSVDELINAYGDAGRISSEMYLKRWDKTCIIYSYRFGRRSVNELEFIVDNNTRKIVEIRINAWN